MSFELASGAVIKGLTAKKEGDDNNKHLMVHLKLEADADEDILAFFDPKLKHAWFQMDKPKLRFPMMGTTKWRGEFNHMNVQLSGIDIRDSKVRKFELAPYINGAGVKAVKIGFQVAFAPEGRQVAQIAEFLQERVDIIVRPEADLGLAKPGRYPDVERGAAQVDGPPTAERLEGPAEQMLLEDKSNGSVIDAEYTQTDPPSKPKKRRPPKTTKKGTRRGKRVDKGARP